MPSRQPPPSTLPFESLQPTLPPTTLTLIEQQHHPLPSRILPPVAASGAGICTILLALLFFCRKISRCRTTPTDSKPPHRFSYSSLRRATSSFAPARRIGQGGFGSVYLATLPSTSQRVAVKMMDSGSLQGEREFHNELFVAGKFDSEFLVSILGFATKRHNMLLVYEYMSNGSLQDALLHRKCVELKDWNRRFSIAVDVAKGIEYMHRCDPPIVHCDIKPSNILLDENFRAKIGDFGLSRVKEESIALVEEEVGVKLHGRVEEKRKEEVESNGVEDYGSVMEDTESVVTMTTIGMEEFSVCVDQSPEVHCVDKSPERADRTASVVEVLPETNVRLPAASAESVSGRNVDGIVNGGDRGDEVTEVGNVVKENGKGKRSVSGKDWRWKQDNGVAPKSGVVKDYVMEWIGTDINKERPKSNWVGSSSGGKKIGKSEKKRNQKQLEWWVTLDEEKNVKKEKKRPAREWWKEEYCDELAKEKKKKRKGQMGKSDRNSEDNWWPIDEDSHADKKKKSKSRNGSSRGSIDWWMDGLSGELWKARRNCHDSMSGEIPKSGCVSSTPSMRGTVCYVAPEYGGNGGGLSEKFDVYSFGVLLLVIIAGRRPLQVTGSPMAEFKRANLISRARHLARAGKLINLVDKSIESLNKTQALLCITVALLCLQKSPSRRPSSKDVLGMLLGESEPPPLPYEFSPSPPTGFPFKSHRKVPGKKFWRNSGLLALKQTKSEEKGCNWPDNFCVLQGVNAQYCPLPMSKFSPYIWKDDQDFPFLPTF